MIHKIFLSIFETIFSFELEKQSVSGIVKEGQEFIIYFESSKFYAFVPCGHVALCLKCSKTLHQENNVTGRFIKCPMCRKDIREVIQIYNV
jgi:hypothetical protein